MSKRQTDTTPSATELARQKSIEDIMAMAAADVTAGNITISPDSPDVFKEISEELHGEPNRNFPDSTHPYDALDDLIRSFDSGMDFRPTEAQTASPGVVGMNITDDEPDEDMALRADIMAEKQIREEAEEKKLIDAIRAAKEKRDHQEAVIQNEKLLRNFEQATFSAAAQTAHQAQLRSKTDRVHSITSTNASDIAQLQQAVRLTRSVVIRTETEHADAQRRVELANKEEHGIALPVSFKNQFQEEAGRAEARLKEAQSYHQQALSALEQGQSKRSHQPTTAHYDVNYQQHQQQVNQLSRQLAEMRNFFSNINPKHDIYKTLRTISEAIRLDNQQLSLLKGKKERHTEIDALVTKNLALLLTIAALERQLNADAISIYATWKNAYEHQGMNLESYDIVKTAITELEQLKVLAGDQALNNIEVIEQELNSKLQSLSHAKIHTDIPEPEAQTDHQAEDSLDRFLQSTDSVVETPPPPEVFIEEEDSISNSDVNSLSATVTRARALSDSLRLGQRPQAQQAIVDDIGAITRGLEQDLQIKQTKLDHVSSNSKQDPFAEVVFGDQISLQAAVKDAESALAQVKDIAEFANKRLSAQQQFSALQDAQLTEDYGAILAEAKSEFLATRDGVKLITAKINKAKTQEQIKEQITPENMNSLRKALDLLLEVRTIQRSLKLMNTNSSKALAQQFQNLGIWMTQDLQTLKEAVERQQEFIENQYITLSNNIFDNIIPNAEQASADNASEKQQTVTDAMQSLDQLRQLADAGSLPLAHFDLLYDKLQELNRDLDEKMGRGRSLSRTAGALYTTAGVLATAAAATGHPGIAATVAIAVLGPAAAKKIGHFFFGERTHKTGDGNVNRFFGLGRVAVSDEPAARPGNTPKPAPFMSETA